MTKSPRVLPSLSPAEGLMPTKPYLLQPDAIASSMISYRNRLTHFLSLPKSINIFKYSETNCLLHMSTSKNHVSSHEQAKISGRIRV